MALSRTAANTGGLTLLLRPRPAWRLGKFLEPAVVPQRREAALAIRMALTGGEVQLDAEAGCLRQRKLAAAHWVPAADQFASPGHVVVAKAFLHADVWRRPAEVDRRGKGNGADGAVRRQRQVVRLR